LNGKEGHGVKKFLFEKNGGVIEYVIVLAVVGVIVASIFPGLRAKISIWHSTLVDHVDQGIGNSPESDPSDPSNPTISIPAYYHSCKEILNHDASSNDGTYKIVLNDSSLEDVYCDMTGGGWTRVSNYDFSSDRTSPTGSGLVAKDPYNSTSYSGTAPSSWYPDFPTWASYTSGYQFKNFFVNNEKITYQDIKIDVDFGFYWTVDSFGNTHGSPANRMSLEGQYLDGVSITYGEPGERTHLWSLTPSGGVPSDARAAFIGSDSYGGSKITRTFTKTLANPTDKRIETRIMLDQPWWDETISMNKFVVWVK
jgi:hypothetical protein